MAQGTGPSPSVHSSSSDVRVRYTPLLWQRFTADVVFLKPPNLTPMWWLQKVSISIIKFTRLIFWRPPLNSEVKIMSYIVLLAITILPVSLSLHRYLTEKVYDVEIYNWVDLSNDKEQRVNCLTLLQVRDHRRSPLWPPAESFGGLWHSCSSLSVTTSTLVYFPIHLFSLQ